MTIWRWTLRKAASIFIVLIVFSLLYLLHGLHLGIERSIVHHVSGVAQKIEILVDKTPPTAPESLSGSSAAAIQRVVSYYNGTHLTSHTMGPFDSTGGDLLVVCAGTHENALLTPSDNFNNTWISLAGPTNFGPTDSSGGINLRAQIWYSKNPKVGPNHIFTMALSTREALVLSMFVITGSNTSDPIDAVSTIGNDANTQALNPTSPGIITTHPDDLLIGFGKSRYGEAWSAGAGFALQEGASSDFLVGESGLAPSPGSYTSTFVINKPTNWQAAVVAVKPAEPLPGAAKITLAWRPASDNVGVVSYEVERCSGVDCEDFVKIGISKGTSFVDTTPSILAVYRYRVRAIDAASNVSKFSNTIVAKAGSATH